MAHINKYSNVVANLTISGIIAVVTAALSKYFKIGSTGAIAITAIAEGVWSYNQENLWFTSHEWGKNWKGTTIPAAQKQRTYTYTDKYRSSKLPVSPNPFEEVIYFPK
ncbi:hypothetical protein [Oceanobacillus bengalensis]|uniref:Uncharacterized protein n=1 Tax=Oceanobacillus bengalensis TaxID=1435466 RepID=A0A494Z3E5_9BACI|nr:hypothetical protein [Oceanobacillus bengalensis]RKQ16824.1 hypothetical protein D8M05_06110 [Oceanobacillus bengalensis]